MKVKVIAPFPIEGLDAEECLELKAGSRVRNVLKGRNLLPGFLLPVFVNGKQARKSQVLKDGDVIVFVFPISGG